MAVALTRHVTTLGLYTIFLRLTLDQSGLVWPDWATDPFTQLKWGKEHLCAKYGDPENALDAWEYNCVNSPQKCWYATTGL